MIDKQEAVQHLAANVAHLMKLHGYSLRSLATAIGSPASTVQTFVSGDNEARFTTVVRVAELFGISTDDLLMPPHEFRRLTSSHTSEVAS